MVFCFFVSFVPTVMLLDFCSEWAIYPIGGKLSAVLTMAKMPTGSAISEHTPKMTHCVLSVSLANGLNNATPNHAPNMLSIQSERSNPPQQENSWNISMAMLIPPAKSNDCLPLSFSNLNSIVIGTKHTTLNIVARISNGRPSKMRSIVYLKGMALNFSRSSMVMPRLNSMCKLLMLLHLNTITQTSKTRYTTSVVTTMSCLGGIFLFLSWVFGIVALPFDMYNCTTMALGCKWYCCNMSNNAICNNSTPNWSKNVALSCDCLR